MTPPASSKTELAERVRVLSEENARLRGDLLTLARRISHDLRTPLSGISLACSVLSESLADKESSEQALIRSIGDATDEIASLIERVSFVVKATANAPAPAPIAMGETVWAALQRLDRRIAKIGGSVTQPASWPTVAGVAPWLEAVWENFVANALQHGGDPPKIELGWAGENGEYRFWTDDRGPGVAAKQVSMLFEPFDQLHRINAPRGLGLALARRLVELQGGRCGYEPRSGGGSRFYFTLPRQS